MTDPQSENGVTALPESKGQDPQLAAQVEAMLSVREGLLLEREALLMQYEAQLKRREAMFGPTFSALQELAYGPIDRNHDA